MTAILSVENLHVTYGTVEALKGVSLELNEGEIVTVLGANGARGSVRSGRPRSGCLTCFQF